MVLSLFIIDGRWQVESSKNNKTVSFSRLQLMECAILEPTEYDKKVLSGQCPPVQKYAKKEKKHKSSLPNSIKRRLKERRKKKEQEKKAKKRMSGSAKKVILKAVFLGKQAVYKLILGHSNVDFELIAGLFLIMECPDQTVEWYIDGQKFEKTSAISWRIRINPEKQLEIWPLLVDEDDGRYECYVNGEPKGAVSLRVITVKEGVIKGIYNYIIAALFSLPIILFAIIFRLMHPPREAIILEDPIVAFYERILDLKSDEIKGHIAKSVYKEKLEEKRAEITTMMTYASKYNVGPDGQRIRNNRDTVMTILTMAEMNNVSNRNRNIEKDFSQKTKK
uniref:Ig-like domain-containing protein n=1 Tax=Ascaris lumbricoides TaxID=6252 RepID=A0A0M3IFA0_ASCLU